MPLTPQDLDTVVSKYGANAGFFHARKEDPETIDSYQDISLPELNATEEEIRAFYSNSDTYPLND